MARRPLEGHGAVKVIAGTVWNVQGPVKDIVMEPEILYVSVPAGSAWFSNEEKKKGTIEVGRLADLPVLSTDYFFVPEEGIKETESVLTIVGGKVVHG